MKSPPLLAVPPLSALGSLLDEEGTTFSVSGPVADRVELCLFNSKGEESRTPMTQDEGGIWRVRLGGIGPGTLYGYRAQGEWAPEKGRMFDSEKLLLDPYGRAVVGQPDFHLSMIHGEGDSSASGLRSVVVDESFDWEGDQHRFVPWDETSIYEVHVKGFTQQLDSVPEELRGTYAGLAHPAAIEKLSELGVSSIQLLPVHLHLNDGFLLEKGLTNYWGYNTLGFFAPHTEWAFNQDPQEQVREFKGMVKALHRAGLEVILDVVYNHTCEGGMDGPILSFRGLDDVGFYTREPGKGEHYWDCTGCGNTVRTDLPGPFRLILDSLRYWVEQMHVDGFRFDLAVALGRENRSFQQEAAFFKAVAQDPVLSKVKMIAEPWDTSQMDSYQVGAFPLPWRDFNDRYRDTARRFWRGDSGIAGAMASALTGSQRIMGANKKSPLGGLNFITCHDGFTLRDFVSFEEKQNQANLEDNRDGTDNNHSWSETDPEVRLRQQRNLLATLFLSTGVPFLLAGDEINRTQDGNNNGYCQDSPISWLDWHLDDDALQLRKFVQRLLAFRKEHSIFRRGEFFSGKKDAISGIKDILWLSPSGEQMNHERWHTDRCTCFSATICSGDGNLILIFNPQGEETRFFLPGLRRVRWQEEVDTVLNTGFVEPEKAHCFRGGDTTTAMAHSLLILRQSEGTAEDGQKIRRR